MLNRKTCFFTILAGFIFPAVILMAAGPGQIEDKTETGGYVELPFFQTPPKNKGNSADFSKELSPEGGPAVTYHFQSGESRRQFLPFFTLGEQERQFLRSGDWDRHMLKLYLKGNGSKQRVRVYLMTPEGKFFCVFTLPDVGWQLLSPDRIGKMPGIQADSLNPAKLTGAYFAADADVSFSAGKLRLYPRTYPLHPVKPEQSNLFPLVGKAPIIDGTLADPCWTKATEIQAATVLGGSGRTPADQTTLKLAYDQTNLYAAITVSSDRMANLAANVAERDGHLYPVAASGLELERYFSRLQRGGLFLFFRLCLSGQERGGRLGSRGRRALGGYRGQSG
jgi:hypothetical protein